MTINYIYTGVGSRKTPAIYNFFCSLVGKEMARQGYALWSGDCHGPDRAFYHGQMEAVREGTNPPLGKIWRAWPTHNKDMVYLNQARRPADFMLFSDMPTTIQLACRDILFSVKPKLRSRWNAINHKTGRPVMGNGAKALLSRDVLQVLGENPLAPNLSDMIFLYCEEIGGIPQGGTATAYLIGKENKVPVYNFYFEENRKRIAEWLGINYQVDFLDYWESHKQMLEPMFRSDHL